jgi:ArsR family transcriptional regulator, virulence genes transcriptional regulator
MAVGASKDQSMAAFAEKAKQAADLLKELANEKRLLVLCALADKRELSVAALSLAVDLSQSALSQHLARLRESGLVTFRRNGATLHYSIANRSVRRILNTLKSIYC